VWKDSLDGSRALDESSVLDLFDLAA